MLNRPVNQRLRHALLAFPVLLVLAMGSPAAANPSNPLQSTGSTQAVTVTDAGSAAVMPAESDTAGAAIDDEGKDLTGFFVIGVVVNIIMIAAFLFWAAGQWRKTKQ